jgi:hypothetical protein
MDKLIKKSFDYGVKAFKDGKDIPARDEDFLMDCLATCLVGEGINMIKAWQKGWHSACDKHLKDIGVF